MADITGPVVINLFQFISMIIINICYSMYYTSYNTAYEVVIITASAAND